MYATHLIEFKKACLLILLSEINEITLQQWLYFKEERKNENKYLRKRKFLGISKDFLA